MISYNKKSSRCERSDYCKLVRLFPSASVEGALRITRMKISRRDYTLDLFITSTDEIKFERLPKIINDKLSAQDQITFQKIIKLIISQSKTCHQGIIGMALTKVCSILQDSALRSHVFKVLINYLASQLSEKKELDDDETKLFFTMFTFTPSPHLIDEKSTQLGFATESINGHYYHSGIRREGPSVVELMKTRRKLYEKNVDVKFKFSSYFSKFKENSLMMIALWQSLFKDLDDRTVASIIQSQFNSESKYWRNAIAQSSQSDPQEFMATFALAHASHKTLPEPVDGLELLETFAKQIQTTSKQISAVPLILKKFLKTIRIPYLIPHNADDGSLALLKELLPLGVCRRAQNAAGVDILFSILDHEIDGFVECKNRKKKLNRVDALEYIIKAINARRPLAIMMCKEIGPSAQSKKKFNEFSDKRVKLESSVTKPKSQTKTKTRSKAQAKSQTRSKAKRKPSTALSFIDAINNDPKLKVRDFNMNIYSLTNDGSDSLKYAVLHEISDPHGVFVIVYSDCEFK